MNDIAENLLNRLDGVRQTTPVTWIAKCPAHDDNSPSLSVRETSDGRLLIHCFSGCGIDAVVSAIGLELSDLYPKDSRAIGHSNPERRPFPPADILKIVHHEALIVQLAADWVLERRELDADDLARVELARDRLSDALEAGGIEA